MKEISKIESYLIRNEIDYFKGETGVISIDINNISKDKFKDYHNFIYTLEKSVQKLN